MQEVKTKADGSTIAVPQQAQEDPIHKAENVVSSTSGPWLAQLRDLFTQWERMELRGFRDSHAHTNLFNEQTSLDQLYQILQTSQVSTAPPVN